jgi:Uma2 family endonuclease
MRILSLAMSTERAYVPNMLPPLMSAEDLLHTSVPDKRTELVRGVLVVREPAGGRHGRVASELSRVIGNHVHAHALGAVYAAETGFTLARRPDTVRAPDVAFVRQDRVPEPEPVGFPELAPDLAVEVLSPGDQPGDTLSKVADWLSAGTRLVWVVDPERRLARVYRHDGTEQIVTADQTLNGEDVLPSFACGLASVL